MGSNVAAVKCYLRSVSKALPCGRKAKKQLLSQISNSIEDYLQENPNADFEMVQSHFGTPQEIVASYINEQDPSALVKKMRIKKKVLVIVSGVMVAILLMWAGSVVWATIDAKNHVGGYIEIIIEQE